MLDVASASLRTDLTSNLDDRDDVDRFMTVTAMSRSTASELGNGWIIIARESGQTVGVAKITGMDSCRNRMLGQCVQCGKSYSMRLLPYDGCHLSGHAPRNPSINDPLILLSQASSPISTLHLA